MNEHVAVGGAIGLGALLLHWGAVGLALCVGISVGLWIIAKLTKKEEEKKEKEKEKENPLTQLLPLFNAIKEIAQKEEQEKEQKPNGVTHP